MKFWAALTFLVSLNTAHAGFLLEPYAGYAISQLDGTNKSSGLREKISDNGLVVGARFAFVMPGGVWFGPDYLYIPSTPVKYEDPPNTPDGTGTRSMLFIDIGFDPPGVPARFFAGYGIINDAKISQSGSESSLSGGAFKLGAGFKPFDRFAINVEYIQHMFSKAKAGSGSEVDIDDGYDNLKAATVLITLSVPLMF